MYGGLRVGWPLFCYYYESLIFSTNFRKILKYPISHKYFQWETSWPMRTDRRVGGQPGRHTTKFIIAVRNFSNSPKTQEWNLTTVTLLIKYHSKIKQRSLTGSNFIISVFKVRAVSQLITQTRVYSFRSYKLLHSSSVRYTFFPIWI